MSLYSLAQDDQAKYFQLNMLLLFLLSKLRFSYLEVFLQVGKNQSIKISLRLAMRYILSLNYSLNLTYD